MIRRPPRSTLFPYTRSSDLRARAARKCRQDPIEQSKIFLATGPASRKRSEEHTSELQSHVNLVCRLLLEKKKTPNISNLIKLEQDDVKFQSAIPRNTTLTKA